VVSLYVVMQSMTTVGYGDFKAKNSTELVFMICLEFIGILVTSLAASTVMDIFKKDISFSE